MHRKTLPLIGIMLAALAAIGVAAVLVWNQLSGDSAATSGAPRKGEVMVAPGLKIGGPFALTDHTGKAVTQEDFAGWYMLVYFGYTFCPDICPTELSRIAAALDIMAKQGPAAAKRVKPIFVTVDPARDTVEVMSDYVSAFHPRLIGLTGPQDAIDEMAKEYHVFYAKGEAVGDGFYLINHSAYVYFMGPDGKFVTMFNGGTDGTDPEVMAEAMLRYVNGAPSS